MTGKEIWAAAFRRAGWALALGIALQTLPTAGEAQASAGCSAVNGAVFSENMVAGVLVEDGLNNEASYRFDAGETINITASLPGLSIVSVTFRGVTVVFNNNINPNPRIFTGTMVAPDNGAGVIEIIGTNSAGGVLSISFSCVSGASSGTERDQAGSVMNSAFTGVVPGGIDGDLLNDFGVPSNPFDPFQTLEGTLRELAGNACEEDVEKARETLLQAVANRNEAVRQLNSLAAEHRAEEAALFEQARAAREELDRQSAREDEVRARKEELLAALGRIQEQERNLQADQSSDADQLRAARDAIEQQIEEVDQQIATNTNAGLARILLMGNGIIAGPGNDFEQRLENMRLRHSIEIQSARGRVAEADRAAADALAAFEAAKLNCLTAGAQAPTPAAQTNYLPAERSLASGTATATLAAGSALDAMAYGQAMPVALMATTNSVAFAYDLDASRRRIEQAFGAQALPGGLTGDPRFNMWLKGSVTFHVDATGQAQHGTTAAVAAGASFRFLPWLSAGAAVRYAHSNRFGPTGSSSADAWSAAAFAQAKLPGELVLSALASYSGVSARATFASGATGTAFGRSLAGQAKLSRSFDLGTWTVTPSLGLAVVNVQRDTFTASDGTQVAASNSTRTTLTFGPSFGPKRGYALRDGKVIVTPSFGVGLFANLGRFDPFIGAGGATVSTDTFGASANTGLAFAFAGGASASLSAAYSGIGATSQSVSLSANLRVPIGRK